MSATIRTTLTGAALAAAITLGGVTSAHAQTYNGPYTDPFPEDSIIVVATDDEQMDGKSDYSRWCTGNTNLGEQHYDWIGVKTGGTAHFNKAFKWQGIYDLYHKGGTVSTGGTNVYFDRVWLTTDTVDARRTESPSSTVVVGDYILQVGTKNVHGESFGNPTADKPLVLNNKSITYNGKSTASSGGSDGWKLDQKGRDTQFSIDNCGEIYDVTVNGGMLNNRSEGDIVYVKQTGGTLNNREYAFIDGLYQTGGTCNNDYLIDTFSMTGGEIRNKGCIEQVRQYGGVCRNVGKVTEYTLKGGTLDNSLGYIDTLYYSGGTIMVKGDIGKIIYVNNIITLDGADEDWQDAVIDAADFDAADWQGEEVIVW